MNRRSFLTGLIAAPVVVRSGVLMPLRGIVMATTLPRVAVIPPDGDFLWKDFFQRLGINPS